MEDTEKYQAKSKASREKRAMAGLDNVTANGLKGFLLLEDVVTSLTDAKVRRALLRQLEQSKRYLKIGYRMHCETLSSCETHCISFALSNKNSRIYSLITITIILKHATNVPCCYQQLRPLSQMFQKIKTRKTN